MTPGAPARWGAPLAAATVLVLVVGVGVGGVVGGGCGDSIPAGDAVVTPVSGDRLKTMWLGYDDGTRQAQPAQLYDAVERTSCAPGRMLDGVLRCVPVAEEAAFVDRLCTQAVGRARAITRPSHFIVHERIAGVRLPARVYRAGAIAARFPTFYERRDGACFGPFTADTEHVPHAVTAEVDVGSLAALEEDEVGDGRLGLTVLTTADGLRLPTTLRDRELDVPCTPALEADGSVRCRPVDVAVAALFADPACRVPGFEHLATTPPPRIAMALAPGGCPRYLGVGPAQPGPPYALQNSQCHRLPVDPARTTYTTTGAVTLPELARTVEQQPGRRLQHIVLADGALRFHDDRLHDTATAEDCRPTAVGEETRCQPETVASASTLYDSIGCQIAVPVAALPQPTCRRPKFARSSAGDLHLIGDPVLEPLYHAFIDQSACQPYIAPAGSLPHALGPALAPSLFVRAILFGER